MTIVRTIVTTAGVALLLFAGWLVWEAWWFVDGCYFNGALWFGAGTDTLLTDIQVNGESVEPWQLIASLAVAALVASLVSAACFIVAMLAKPIPRYEGRES